MIPSIPAKLIVWALPFTPKVRTALPAAMDLEKLPHADMNLVGSGGIALSGGQKQRVLLRHWQEPYIPANLSCCLITYSAP
ncbi:uncharacterized protein GGS25DRAFT_163404 [Hypoxylon fragiforme]|uniref:uncharacterized protein n=1 Tax=Hypoxylon fragiforme TaxID=63214 RepID=UPI0020C6CFE5|nr:uncharacterized protein GGS25DRAFT_163404 [Hypoxylon fragiforme]KAI2610765.1 hypothetical protein GGS25DRAFT_163404 [Hypoxylon fragiforme]